MTREEAIARIKEHKAIHKIDEPRAIYISEALDMAIKVLEQEPCEDCISRAEVFETYSVLYDVFDDNPNICNELHKVFVKLNKLPSVTSQQKVGKWLIILNDYEHYMCNQCCKWINKQEANNYCPHCGSYNGGEKGC